MPTTTQILNVVELINLITPEVVKLVVTLRNHDGTTRDIEVNLDEAKANFQATLDEISQWKARQKEGGQ